MKAQQSQRPHHRFASFFQIPKQQPDVEVVAVQVVQVNHVRVLDLDHLYEHLGRSCRAEAVSVKGPASGNVHVGIKPGTDA